MNVAAVNDAPTVVGAVADVEVDEDAANTNLDFSTVFTDADIATNSDELTLSVAGITGGGFFESVEIVDDAPVAAGLLDSTLPFLEPLQVLARIDVVRAQFGNVQRDHLEPLELDIDITNVTLLQILLEVREN